MAALAEKVGRPVKWIETRSENYVATTHGRDHVTYIKVGREARRDDHDAEGEDVRESRRHPVDDRGRYLRRPSTAACSPAPTGSRTSTSRCSASTRTRAWSTPTAAPAVPKPRTPSSARSTSWRASSSSTPWRCGERTSSRPTPSRMTLRASSPGWSTTPATTTRRSTRALEMVGYEDFRSAQEAARAEGRYLGIGLLELRRDLRRRSVCLDRHRRPGLGRGPLGERERACPPDRQGRRDHRLALARARPRDDDGAGGGVGARRAGRGRDRRVRRHPRHPVRIRHLREP